MRILIVGGGIAGLTLANLLQQRGITPRIVEARAPSSVRGYTLGLWPMGGRVLKGLGLHGQLENASLALINFSMGAANGQILHSFQVPKIATLIGDIRMVRRRELTAILAAPCADLIQYNTTVTDITQDAGECAVTLSDGTIGYYDLVVGCDGINSKIRKMAVSQDTLQDTGWSAWGWWADQGAAANDTMTEYWEPGRKFCAAFPAPNGLSVFVGLPTHDIPEGSADDLDWLRKQFSGMGENVQNLFEARKVDQPVYTDVFRTFSTDTWCKERVLLIGDAASAYFPFGGLGIGASMAMESAAVLADELSRTDARFLDVTLASYEQRRRPRIQMFEQAMQSVVDTKLNQETPMPEVMDHMRGMFGSFREMMTAPI